MPDASELTYRKELGGPLKRMVLKSSRCQTSSPEALALHPLLTRGLAIVFHTTEINNHFIQDQSLSQNNLTLELGVPAWQNSQTLEREPHANTNKRNHINRQHQRD